jgi:hypothetical protein
MSLRGRALAAFGTALAAVGDDPALRTVHDAIAAHRDRYQRKMTVALVGRVSSGKSTLANALLGAAYAPTGIGELTYNVSWLRRGRDSGVTVHFTGGRPAERHSLSDLDALAARSHRDPALRDYLAAIDYLEVTDLNPRLEPFDLVDTPGLDAASGGAQARKTMAFLGRTPEDVQAQTVAFASRADALVIVFPKAQSAVDARLAADFTSARIGVANPVTAVGVLTKIEADWHWPDRPEPMTEGRRRAEALLAMPGMASVLFELRPLAGKMAAAASLLTDPDFDDLAAFKDMNDAELGQRLKFGPAFKKAPYPELPLSPGRRGALFDLLSGYGFFVASGLVRDGIASTPDELREQLAEASGLNDLRRLLQDHFASRADVIKLRRVIDDVAGLPRRDVAGLSPRALDRTWRAVAEITDLDAEPAFRRLAVLHDYWQGLLTFTAGEGEELLRVAGERGPRLTDRLGVPEVTQSGELAFIAAAGHERWSRAVLDTAYRGPSRAACTVMLRAYDEITDEINRTVIDA